MLGKIAFHFFLIGILIPSVFIGIFAGEHLADTLINFGLTQGSELEFDSDKLILLACVVICNFAVMLSVIFIIILPVCFLFPNASTPFKWQKTPQWALSVLSWYKKGLDNYLSKIDRNS